MTLSRHSHESDPSILPPRSLSIWRERGSEGLAAAPIKATADSSAAIYRLMYRLALALIALELVVVAAVVVVLRG